MSGSQGPLKRFVDLQCPSCGQHVRVWEGVEATCVGERGQHKVKVMERVVGKDPEPLEGQMRIEDVMAVESEETDQ